MNPADIKTLIDSGESSRIEFKSGAFHNESLAKEIVAFANMRDGQILLGVEDNGLVDKLGRGLQKIMRHYASAKWPSPEFDQSGDFFKVTVYRAGPPDIRE